MKEHILHLRRHMDAREPLLVGMSLAVPGTQDTTLVGNGLHPDGGAHLQARDGRISDAELKRTGDDPVVYEREIPLNMDVLRSCAD